MIGTDLTLDTKGSHRPVCFFHPGAGSEIYFPSNSVSVSVEYNQRLQPTFREHGGVLQI